MRGKRWNPNGNGDTRDKAALKTTCIKYVNFKIIKKKTSCQFVGCFYYSENLNWAAQNFDCATCGPRAPGWT